MEWFSVKLLSLWVVIALMLQMSGSSKGCLEKERMGLLELKAFIKSQSENIDILPSWVDDHAEADCCAWERVKCNATTGRVMELSLDGIRPSSTWPEGELCSNQKIWLLNISLFHPFGDLISLDFSYNFAVGSVFNEGSFPSLMKLEILNLGSDCLRRSVLLPLSAFRSLKTLILADNRIEGSFPSQELAKLRNLEALDLRLNQFNGSLPKHGFDSLSRLKKLETLGLGNNRFNRSTIQSLSALTSLKNLILTDNQLEGSFLAQELAKFRNLKVLDLSWNKFNGSLPNQGLCQLKKLEELDLSQNMLEGTLPQCLHNLTSLRLLDLSKNLFTGTISSSLIANLNSLEYIDFSYNNFEGLFSFSLFANHSKLEVVQFISDNDKFHIETEIPSWVPLFQLKVLVLCNCNLNKLSNGIPMFLLHQYSLREVDLSHNKLKGSFPSWFLNNNTGLEFLNLRNNSFMGQFYLPLYPNKNTFWMDVSNNQFDCQLQGNIGTILPQLQSLNLSRNAFQGYLPSSIGDIRNLVVLDVSFNNFVGEVPLKLVSACMNLLFLKLSHNNFYGQIFSEHFNLTALWELQLNDNQFTGTLSNVVTRCSYLFTLDISNNYMSGNISPWIGNLTHLSILILQNNSFDGQIPCELVSPEFLDLSHNSFTGSLHPCLNLQNTSYMYLQGNNFIGSIPNAIFSSSNLLLMDIRDNCLSGGIPNSIGTVSSLRVLLLGGNHLSGTIPSQLCQLNKISIMDLSRNSFLGSIPRCFHNITFGRIGYNEISIAAQSLNGISSYMSYNYRRFLKKANLIHNTEFDSMAPTVVEFVTKYRPSSYKGIILDLMYGLDLSCNNLTGGIPDELGKLSSIHALNLSYNQLTGSIPRSFSNLTELESLDLSHNNLSGGIPSQLIELYFLEVFTVAHNNLSGRIPDMKAQFATFEVSSYEGNPFLCGPPTERNCSNIVDESPNVAAKFSNVSDGKWYEVDPVVFAASFSVSYIMFFLGVVTLLYVNPYWRQRCFYFIEDCACSLYNFAAGTLRKFSA